MINHITEKYAGKRLTLNSRTPKGLLHALFEEAKVKYNVSETINLKNVQKCVQTRFQRNSLRCSHRGTVSPIAPLEPLILEIALQKGRTNQLLAVEEGLHLSNSLIKPGSKIEKDVISYLSKQRQYSSSGSKSRHLEYFWELDTGEAFVNNTITDLYQREVYSLGTIEVSGVSTKISRKCMTSCTRPWRLLELPRNFLNLNGKTEKEKR